MSVHQADAATYDDRGRLLRHTHDSQANRQSPDSDILPTLYVVGDEDTEGSIRFIFTAEGIAHVEKRENNVWNSGSLEVGTQSVRLGDNLSLNAIGDSLQISSLERERRSLAAHTNIDDDGALFPHIVQAGALIERNIFQADDSTDNVLTTHRFPIAPVGRLQLPEGFLYTIFLKVGAVAPTSEVMLTFSDGLLPGGLVLLTLNYPASDFPANTEIELVLEGGISFQPGADSLITLQSTTAFSLKGTAVEIMWLAADFQLTVNEELVLENAVFNNDLGHIFNAVLDPVYINPVFV